MIARTSTRIVVFAIAGCLLLGWSGRSALALTEPQPSQPLTAERLKERDRFSAEVEKLQAAGKLAEAVAAAEKMLSIEREVFGSVHPDVADSLGWLANLHEQREDFAAARKARKEVLGIRTQLQGEKHWQVTDARLELADGDLREKLDGERRRQVREADSLMQQVGRLHGQGKAREALPLAEKACRIRRDIYGEKHRQYATAVSWVGFLYNSMGDYAKAEPLYRQGLDILRQVLGERHPDYAISLSNLAALYAVKGDYARAEPLCRQALDIKRQVLGERHPEYAQSLNNLAYLYDSMGDYAKAEPLYLQALDIKRQVLGEKHPAYATSLNNLALLYQAMGNYAKAEALYLQALDIRKQVLGEKHPAFATSLNSLAVLYNSKGDYARAEPLFRRALDLRKQALGEKHPAYATSLNNLAELYRSRGDYSKAEPLCRRALDICKEVLGERHPNYAYCLNSLAGLYRDMGDYGRAKSLYLRAVDLRKEALGERHPDYAYSLNSLASLYQAMGYYAKAEPLYHQALDITKRASGEKNSQYASVLNNLAGLFEAVGDYARAELLFQQALGITKQVLGEKHPAYATNLNNLGFLYRSMGEYSKSEPLYRQALDITRRALGAKHPDYAIDLDNLGSLYHSRGDYARAEPLFRQALDLRRRVLGEKHPSCATSLDSLGGLYLSMGDYARAEPLYRQALDIRKQALSESHPDYAHSLTSLAELYHRMGAYARAEPLFRQALEIRQQALGERHRSYALSLHNLAGLYESMGAYAKAEPLYRQALDIKKQALGEGHPSYAASLHNLAALYHLMGDSAKAEPLFRQALDIKKQALGEKHPSYANTLNHLALLSLAKNERTQAPKLARQAWRLIRAQLVFTADVQSERQQLRMNEQLRYYLDSFLSVASAERMPAEEVYAEVLIAKGAVSLRQQQMRRLRGELIARDPQAARLYADLGAATRRLAALVNAAPARQQLDDYHRRLDEANAEVERLQKELAASAAFRQELERSRLTPGQLRQVLPAGVGLVDLMEYWHFTPQTKGRGTWERRLAAFVVRKDRPVDWVDLGPVETLKEAIEPWLKSLESDDRRVQRTRPIFGDGDPAITLRERLWEPLEPHLKDIATVLISPDGEVARLPWGALPGSTPDKYLLEERAIALIAIPQFLPELLQGDKEADTRPPSLLLVGDVDYGAAPGKANVEIASRGLSTVLQRGGGASWKHLEATKREAATIRDVFQRSFPSGTAKLLDEDRATEGAVRAQASQHAWLHLATHGYFAPMKVQSALGRGKNCTEPALSMAEQRGFVGFPQGLLAGVVLAGANKGGGEGEDDGILTAMEVAELDLRRCQLAVLSACETGLGEKSGGEGVLGLQRAFQVAGARGVVASLWSVPDEATHALMERFYDNLWQKKMSRLESLREAQRWLLTKDAKDKKRMPPLFWAAFVLSGDWR